MTRSIWTMGFVAVGFVGCKADVQDPDDIPAGTPTGTLVVALSDTDDGDVESSVEEVQIRLEDVQVQHVEEGWLSLAGETADYDLFAIRGGSDGQIAEDDVYTGSYDKVRLIVTDAFVVVDGEQSDLRIDEGLGLPSEGIDISQSFTVSQDQTTRLTIEWDLDTQLSQNDGSWSLGTSGASVVVDNGE
ncbi:MAG: DUF4382 domain-containing protein [Myxococcota bacterium]